MGFLNSGHLQRVNASSANETPVDKSTMGWNTTSKSPTVRSRTEAEEGAGRVGIRSLGTARVSGGGLEAWVSSEPE